MFDTGKRCVAVGWPLQSIGKTLYFYTWKGKHEKKDLYNFDPLKPNFYIVKLEFTGVYIIFSYFSIDCGTR